MLFLSFSVVRGRHTVHAAEALDEVAEVVEADGEADIHDRQVGLAQQTRRLLDAQGVYVLGEGAAEVLLEEGAEILRRQAEVRGDLGEREALGEVLAEVADDLAQLTRLVVRAGAHTPPFEAAVLGADRDDAEQGGLNGELTAGGLLLPRADDLREEGAHLGLTGFAGADAGRKAQLSLRERLKEGELGFIGAGELEKIRRENERAELVLAPGGAYLVQLLGGGEKDVAPRTLVNVVGNRQRHAAAVHLDDLELGMPVIGDEIAVTGLAPVERGIDLKREGERSVLLAFASCGVHGVPPCGSAAIFLSRETP